MRRRRRWNLALTVALCASLVLHGLVYDAIVVRQTQEVAATIHQPPFDLKAWLEAHREPEQEVELPPLPPPVAQTKPPEIEVEELFGERGSKGKALNKVDGQQDMVAPESKQEQAALTPRPGAPSPGGDGGQASAMKAQASPSAAAAVAIAVQPASETPAAPLLPAPPPLPPKAFEERRPPIIGIPVPGRETSPTTRSAVTLDDSPATRPVENKPATKPVNLAVQLPPTTSPVVDRATTRPVELAKAVPTTQPVVERKPTTQPARPTPTVVASIVPVRPIEPTPQATSTGGGSPGRGPAGDVGNKSESESDAFSDRPTVVFRNGRVVARDGRHVKSVKPKLTEAGRLALAAMEEPIIIIKVKIDEQGHVTDADYLRKSGIPEVDQPHLRAAYDWEFDPTRDATGKPVKDTQIIDFVWQ
jgi:hypothetical protein